MMLQPWCIILGIYNCFRVATGKADIIVSHREDVGESVWPIDPICGFVAATNIESIHSMWSCSVSGTADSEICNWVGLYCHHLGEVSSILLQNESQLVGTLSPSLGSIATMQEIVLFSNSLTGTLPSFWGSMTGLLLLSIYSNSLTGTLPSSWGSMTGMLEFSLYSNSLTGTLPSSWGSMTGMLDFSLYSNSLTGTLPSSWGSMTGIQYLSLNSNSQTGPLPSSWGSMTGIQQLYLYSNSLTGSLPSSWGSMTGMLYMYLHSNSLTGSLPSSWGSVTGIRDLFLNSNFLTGSLPSSWGNMAPLRFLIASDNSLSGTLPSFLGSLSLLMALVFTSNDLSGSLPERLGSLTNLQYLSLSTNRLTGPVSWALGLLDINIDDNIFTGSMPTSAEAYPSVLQSLNVANNLLTGSVPSAIALLRNLSNFNISNNNIVGSIPSEFCSSEGISIDVSGSAINCYSGCLTSEHVLVTGASPEYHDGSEIVRFLVISGVVIVIAILCTLLHRSYDWWAPAVLSRLNSGVCEFDRFKAWGWLSNDVVDRDRSALDKSNTVFGIAVAKFLFGTAVALSLPDWWRYSGGSDVPGNDVVLASCSNPTIGNCFSYCGDVDVITVNIATDDVVVGDDYYVNPRAETTSHSQITGYCVALLPGYCGYELWLDLKLLPLLLQLFAVVLQVVLWQWGSSGFTSTPQRAQYELLLGQLYPQVQTSRGVDLKKTENEPPGNCLASRLALLRRLATPLFPCVFWFLELVTVVYVWSELLFPPVYCGSVPPLSLYYYPILMSLLDLMKLNIYTSLELFKAKRRLESVLALLDLQLFFTHMWVTVALGLIFVGAVVRDSVRGVWWCVSVVTGRRESPLAWADKAQPTDVELATVAAGGDVSNPIADAATTNPA